MATDPAASGRRAFIALVVLAGLWALLVALTGGVRVTVAGIRISSRSATNPILLAFISACTVAWLSLRSGGNGRALVHEDLRWWWTATHLRSILGWLLYPATLAALGGAALRFRDWAGGRPLWLDEQMVALNLRDRTLPELAGGLWLDQSAPLGWLATERAAILMFGFGETVLRFVPLVFGIAVLGAALWIGARWMTPAAACVLVLLCALGEWVFHYSLELKHYSADLFFGLTLPALAVWAIEAPGPSHRLRRALIWWAVAAVGQWCANGALFVTPACALALLLSLWRVDGRKGAVVFASAGLVWLVSFALHYYAATRFTFENDRLRQVWSWAMPPVGAGVFETLQWLIGQTGTFTTRPGGSDLTALFWLVILTGVLFARPRLLGLLVAAVTLSLCVIAAMRFVPLYERLSIWVVPALYLGIALCIDAGIRWARTWYEQEHRARAAIAALATVAGLWLSVDVAAGGWRAIQVARPDDSNHQLDDRTAVEWLLAQRDGGGVVLTTHLALPAVWWYGDVPVSLPTLGAVLDDGSPILEVDYDQQGESCQSDALRRALLAHRRALVYLGFRFDDVPPGFDDVLFEELRLIGPVTEARRFTGVTRAVVVEIGAGQPEPPGTTARRDSLARTTGCISVRPAKRW